MSTEPLSAEEIEKARELGPRAAAKWYGDRLFATIAVLTARCEAAEAALTEYAGQLTATRAERDCYTGTAALVIEFADTCAAMPNERLLSSWVAEKIRESVEGMATYA